MVVSLLFGGALLQASFFPSIGLVSVRPDLVLVVVVIWAVLRGAREALLWAAAGGAMLDLLSGAPFGTAMLAMVVVAFLSSIGEISLFRHSLVLPLVTVFWASVIYSLLYLFVLRTHEYSVEWLGTLRQVVVPTALLNTVVAPLVYAALSRIERRTRRSITVEW
jgi:rod shape-determining protein MreD